MADARLRPEPSSLKRGLGGIVRNMAPKSIVHCCTPLCRQRERVRPKENELDSLKFQTKRKWRWIHAIRRDVGRFFRISEASKVCSLQFKLGDRSQDLGGLMPLKTSAVPSIFAQKQTQSCKRPPPNERPYQRQRKEGESVPERGSFSVSSEPEILISKIPEAANSIPETVNNETILEITNPAPVKCLPLKRIWMRSSNN